MFGFYFLRKRDKVDSDGIPSGLKAIFHINLTNNIFSNYLVSII